MSVVALLNTLLKNASIRINYHSGLRSYTLMSSIPILLLSFATPSTANVGVISIDGEPIAPVFFAANTLLPVISEDYCYPDTDKARINYVVGRMLILEHGMAEGLPVDDVTARDQARMLTQLNDASELQRVKAAKSLLNTHTEVYLRQLVQPVSIDDAKNRYLSMLAADDPLIVNALWVRAATLSFWRFIDADEAVERLVTGETIDKVEQSHGQLSTNHENNKNVWLHAASMPESMLAEPLKLGAIVGPFYRTGRWHVRIILDTKRQPVTLFADGGSRYFNNVGNAIKNRLEDQALADLIADLWASADVLVQGQQILQPYTIDCREPVF